MLWQTGESGCLVWPNQGKLSLLAPAIVLIESSQRSLVFLCLLRHSKTTKPALKASLKVPSFALYWVLSSDLVLVSGLRVTASTLRMRKVTEGSFHEWPFVVVLVVILVKRRKR